MSLYFSDQLQKLQEQAKTSQWTFRQNALEIFHTYGLPHRKQDPWKYVDNSALLNLPFIESCPKVKTDESTYRQTQIVEQAVEPENMDFVCFDNGVVTTSSLLDSLKLLEIQDIEQNLAKWQLDKASLQAEENSYSLINAFSFEHAYELKLGRKNSVVRLRFCGDFSYQALRLYIEIPADCDISLLIDSQELGENAYWNPYFHFVLGENSHLTLLERGPRLSAEQSQHVRSVSLRGRVSAGAQVHSALFYWGTALSIHDARLAICGEAADVQMRGICFGEGTSRYHMRCENQHLAPRSESQCLYKNVLFDKASSEFYGIIRANNDAVGTNAGQSNQNLLLSNQARAIARPQLEILIDDLKCQHGSSTGSIDAEELFYMRVRGLNQHEAMRLAVVGFVEEISTYFSAKLLDALNIEDCLHALLDKRNT